MKNIGYYNGTFGPIEKMCVPMGDRAVYFGDGVYDVTYAINHILFAIDDHLDRFYRSMGKLQIPFAMDRAELARTLQQMVDKVDDTESLQVYWQASRGTSLRNHVFPGSGVPANLMIMITPEPLTPIRQRFRAITVDDSRFFHCDIKTLNLIPNVMASQKAKEAGCDEAIFHRGTIVTECAHSNVSILKDGVLRTAPLSNLILPGTARKHLIVLAEQEGIPADQTPFTVQEMMEADEVVFHSSGTLCNAFDEIDGKKVGGRAPQLLEKLQDAAVRQMEEYTHSKFSDYAK